VLRPALSNIKSEGKRLANLRIIDVSTGEDFSQEYTLRHRNQDEAFKTRNALLEGGRQREFTFGNMLNLPEVIAAIDDKYCGYLLYLQTYIDYDGVLTGGNKPMNRADIQKALGLADRAFKSFIKEMTTNGIIAEDNGKHRVNPAYHFKGATDNRHVIKTFSAKVRSLYTVKNAKKLGFIYKLLPHIHFETNTVCENPFEQDVEKVDKLSKQQIAEITGVSEKTVYTYLRRMKLGDEFVFAEIRRGNTKYYKLNPFIFYRRTGEPDATLREIFRLGFSGH
jgi:hypothetical protein